MNVSNETDASKEREKKTARNDERRSQRTARDARDENARSREKSETTVSAA